MIDAQSVANPGAPATPGSKGLLCNEGMIICVSRSWTNAQLINPFKMDVYVNSADDIQVAWEIQDSTGQVLSSSSTDNDGAVQTRKSQNRTTWHIQSIIIAPAKSQQGTLSLRSFLDTSQTDNADLPEMKIPVKLTTDRSWATIMEFPKSEASNSVIDDWISSQNPSESGPDVQLVPHRVEVMQFDRTAIIGVTAEAVLQSSPGQGPWTVTQWHRDGSTAHITIHGDGWAGVTYYLTEVTYLIKKSVLKLPGIKQVVFDQAK